jgi:signal transduction histidine kinase
MSSGNSRQTATAVAAAVAAKFTAAVAVGVTNPPAPRPRRLRRGPFDLVFVADAVFAIICFATTDSWLETQNSRHANLYSTETLLLFAAAVSVPVLLRTRFPATAWAVSAVAITAASVVLGSLSSAVYVPGGLLVYALCLYAVAVRGRIWFVVSADVATVVGAVIIDARTSAAAVILVAIPMLGGAIVRSRRSSAAELARQARRMEGERALLQERQRIARELHDIVAHHMSVIAIQAEAAPRKVAYTPPELAESFTEIRASALSGLDELRRLLGVLRSGGADTAPQPGLDELAGLLESARSGGVSVTSSVSGMSRPLRQGMDLSAYRIVQEALSNAMRHAPGSAVRVELAYTPGSVVIKVRNDACASGGSPAVRRAWPGGTTASGNGQGPDDQGGGGNGTGHGIIGMRERAAMLGGHLAVGPTGDGGFLVTAVLPDNQDHLEGPP